MVTPASSAGAASSASSTGMPATWASTSECVVVPVVPAGPGVWRGLGPALGGVLPLLLAAVWGDVEEAPGRPERLVTTGVDEVRAVDLVAVAQEHVRAVPLRDVVVGVEVVAQRVPGELPAHVLAIALQVLLLAAADGDEAGVALAQVQQVAQLVGVHRAAGAAALRVDVHVRIHEEPVHDELAAAVEELEQRRVPAAGRGEAIVLLHAEHRHAAALGREGVTRAGVRLLPLEQRLARGAPLLRGDDVGLGGAHRGLRIVVVTCHHWYGSSCGQPPRP